MKELQQASLLPADYAKEAFPKKAVKFVLKKAIRFAPASVLIFAGCSGGNGAEKNTKELESNESGYALPFPKGETWFLTAGPHEDGYSNGVKYAIDIAPPEVVNCTPGARIALENRTVTASASGKVTLVGNDNNREDPNHSMVDVKDKQGLTERYIHLDHTKVKKGDKVKQGQALGDPSCEFPPGGANTGIHVHVGLMKDGQAIPIDGAVVGGWTIHDGVNGKDGTMTKDGEKTRTADKGRFGENSTGIRNDLPNTSNKAIIASPKDPIHPISGTVREKSIAPTTETKKPAAIEKQPKTLEEQAKLLALNNFLHPLSKTQEAEVDYFGNKSLVTLDSKIVQDMTASKIDIIQGKQSQDTDRLSVRWNTSEFTKWGTSKNLGEAEIKGIQMQLASQPITRAEQANGIQWKGAVQINYLAHWRFVLPVYTGGRGSPGTKREWTIANPQIPVGLPFSPWAEQRWSDSLILANGRWTSSNDQPANEITTRVLYPLDVSTITGADKSNPCAPGFGGSIPGCLELQLGPRPEITFKDYSSRALPYKLSYPEDWAVDAKTTSDKIIESFTSPYDPQEQVKIVRQAVKHGTTTEEYGKNLDAELCELWGCSDTGIKDFGASGLSGDPCNWGGCGPHLPFLRETKTYSFGLIARQPGRRVTAGWAYAFVKDGYGWVVLMSEDSDRSIASIETSSKIFNSFKFTQSPESTSPAQSENKTSISKTPDELYRALLTSPFPGNVFPGFPGYIPFKGNAERLPLHFFRGKSVGKLDETAQAFKAVGRVNVLVEDNNLQLSGLPTGTIYYTIFPNNSNAKSAYDAIVTSSNNAHGIKGFAYPTIALSESDFGISTTVISMQVENVLVATAYTGDDDPVNQEGKLIPLTKAALEHLGKVGK